MSNPLAYAPPLKWHHRRKYRRLLFAAALAAVLIATFVLVRQWKDPLISWLKLTRSEWRAAHYTPSPARIVFDEDPNSFARLAAAGYTVIAKPFGMPRGFAIAPNPLSDTLYLNPGSSRLAFIHQRTSAHGMRRVVTVVFSPRADALCFACGVTPAEVQYHTLFDAILTNNSARARGVVNVFRQPEEIARVYHGSIDPHDEAAFTIEIDLNASLRVTLRGTLNDDGTVTLLPTAGWVAGFVNGVWCIPAGRPIPRQFDGAYFVDAAKSPGAIRVVSQAFGGGDPNVELAPKLKPATTAVQ